LEKEKGVVLSGTGPADIPHAGVFESNRRGGGGGGGGVKISHYRYLDCHTPTESYGVLPPPFEKLLGPSRCRNVASPLYVT